MKTKILKLSMLSLATMALVFTSCSGDDNGGDNPTKPTCDDNIQNGDETGVDCGGSCEPCENPATTLTGSISEDMTLDPAETYVLQGSFSVESGATLTIPAGTTITAEVEDGTETKTYIVVQKGGMIDVQGTEGNPVILTSANEEPGDWGGLILAGNATTTEGVDAEAEVGGIIYGGTDDADNSGSIDYLIINYFKVVSFIHFFSTKKLNSCFHYFEKNDLISRYIINLFLMLWFIRNPKKQGSFIIGKSTTFD